MYMCLCVFMYVHVCEGQRPMSGVCCSLPNLCFETVPGVHLCSYTGWPLSSKGLPVSTFSVWHYKWVPVPGVFRGAWDLNSGPYVYRVNLYPLSHLPNPAVWILSFLSADKAS